MSAEVADAVRGKARVIAVNNTGVAFRKTDQTWCEAFAPWADVLYAADASWWMHHAQEALKFKGLKVTIGANTIFPAVLALMNGGDAGFDERPTHLRTGKNSGYQAVHLAAHFGAKRILLCGFDMGGTHYFGPHPRPLYRESPYAQFIGHFERVAPIYRARRIEIINCTPGSALKCFPEMKLEDALAGVPVDPRRAVLSA